MNASRENATPVNGAAPSRAALARGLGLSRSLMTRYGKRGMPLHSVEAAQAWRRQHLNIAARKPEPKPDGEASALLHRVTAWGALAEQALRSGNFDLIADDLREAMRRVPRDRRADVELPVEVWRALLAHIWAIFGPDEPAAPLATQAQLDEIAPLLYQLSCDEAILRDGDMPAPAAAAPVK